MAKIKFQALPALLLLVCGVAAYQVAWLPAVVRRAHLSVERERLRMELAAQEQLLGQREAILEAERKGRQQRLELARLLPPESSWPKMLAEVERLFLSNGLTVTSFRVGALVPLADAGAGGTERPPPASTQGGTAVPALQPGELLAARCTATVTADSKEAFFSLLAGLEALDFLAPVRSVSYKLAEGKVQARLEFELLITHE